MIIVSALINKPNMKPKKKAMCGDSDSDQEFAFQYKKETELSKYIWRRKYKKINYTIRWKIFRNSTGYNKISKSCNLCLSEKLEICKFRDKNALLNKRNELISKCRHENKHLLANFIEP